MIRPFRLFAIPAPPPFPRWAPGLPSAFMVAAPSLHIVSRRRQYRRFLLPGAYQKSRASSKNARKRFLRRTEGGLLFLSLFAESSGCGTSGVLCWTGSRWILTIEPREWLEDILVRLPAYTGGIGALLPRNWRKVAATCSE